ncbi:Skp1 family, dimerization domain-containing protein [Geranomyces variabilis]|nr:Skp1 family, dimerization domain-containing protein [Geranomyces variabilis]
MATVKFTSSDGIAFEVPRDIACVSVLIKDILHDVTEASCPVPLPRVSGKVFEKIIEYATYHQERDNPSLRPATTSPLALKPAEDLPEICDSDTKFMASLDRPMLIELMSASNYLDIQGLLELTCRTTAGIIKDMPVDEVKKVFGITEANTPQEQERIRQVRWAVQTNA